MADKVARGPVGRISAQRVIRRLKAWRITLPPSLRYGGQAANPPYGAVMTRPD
jgi:hypothetical protein